MNKKLLIIAILAVIGIGGGALAYGGVQSRNKAAEQMAMQKKSAEDLAMKKTKEADSMAKDKQADATAIVKDGDAMQKDGAAMAKGSYVDYDSAKLANADKGKVILFFHAPWCPVCREADKNFAGSPAPDGLTLLKVDYDSSGDLKKKYGVTYQHTYVQVDSGGKLLKKWSGSTSYDAIKSQEI